MRDGQALFNKVLQFLYNESLVQINGALILYPYESGGIEDVDVYDLYSILRKLKVDYKVVDIIHTPTMFEYPYDSESPYPTLTGYDINNMWTVELNNKFNNFAKKYISDNKFSQTLKYGGDIASRFQDLLLIENGSIFEDNKKISEITLPDGIVRFKFLQRLMSEAASQDDPKYVPLFDLHEYVDRSTDYQSLYTKVNNKVLKDSSYRIFSSKGKGYMIKSIGKDTE